jgi:hypothetical protein
MEFTHLDHHVGQDERERALPAEEEVLEHLRAIEATLSSRLTKFFDNRRVIDEFLTEVNKQMFDQDSSDGNGYVSPTGHMIVRDILTRIGSLPLRRVFYGGMQNPRWVSALADEGAFKNPPEPHQDDEGNVREEPWPEMDYLVRMARFVPQDIVDVGLTLIKSKNSWVRSNAVYLARCVNVSAWRVVDG